MKKLYLISFIAIVTAFASCERLMMPKKPTTRPFTIWETIWKKMNTGYAYFDYKGVNWDSVQFDYMFRVSDTFNERQLFDTCAQMLNILKDPKVSLHAGFATSYYIKPDIYKQNFNRQLLERAYWKGYEKTGPLIYTVIDSVSYIYYGSFDDDVSDTQIDFVIERLKVLGGKKGAILDLRNNTGGKTDNMFTMFRHMGFDTAGYDYSTYLYQTAYKKGPARDEFTDYVGTFIDKNDNKKFAKKIRVLTNRAMYGTANVFSAGSQSFFNVKVMGDTTGGGGGLVSSYELPNGWVLTYTSSKIRMSDGTYMEDGVAPDTTIHVTPTDEAAGKDTILEAALADLLKK